MRSSSATSAWNGWVWAAVSAVLVSVVSVLIGSLLGVTRWTAASGGFERNMLRPGRTFNGAVPGFRCARRIS